MIELFTIAVFIYLMCKGICLAFRLSWGLAKISASILMLLATPILILGIIFAGGIALILPIILIAIAIGILKSSI